MVEAGDSNLPAWDTLGASVPPFNENTLSASNPPTSGTAIDMPQEAYSSSINTSGPLHCQYPIPEGVNVNEIRYSETSDTPILPSIEDTVPLKSEYKCATAPTIKKEYPGDSIIGNIWGMEEAVDVDAESDTVPAKPSAALKNENFENDADVIHIKTEQVSGNVIKNIWDIKEAIDLDFEGNTKPAVQHSSKLKDDLRFQEVEKQRKRENSDRERIAKARHRLQVRSTSGSNSVRLSAQANPEPLRCVKSFLY
jgi:hypothetical protein